MNSNMYGYSNAHYDRSQQHGSGQISASQLIILDNECADCGKQFTNVSNLNRHVRKIHKREPNPLPQPVARLTVNCPVCPHQFCTRKELDGHLQFDHDISVSLVRVEFDTMAEFANWKRGIERETVAYYAVERTVVNVKSKKTMYGCHRSGTFTSQRKGSGQRVREGKAKGSIKMGAVCPSRIAVHQTPDKIYVDFVSTHVGHDRDPAAVVQTAGGTGSRKKNLPPSDVSTSGATDNSFPIAAAEDPKLPDASSAGTESQLASTATRQGTRPTAARRPRGKGGSAARPKVNKALLTKRRGDVIAKLSSLITFVRDCNSHAQLDLILRHLDPIKPALELMEPSVSPRLTSLSNSTPISTEHVPQIPISSVLVTPATVSSAPIGYSQCQNVATMFQQHQQSQHQQHIS